jgi:peptidoglycan/xylan/chitin deacetylase (PgdA/CDA1 family)
MQQGDLFSIGLHISYHPELLKKVIEAGHTVGSHTWSHKDLARLSFEQGKEKIEKGISMGRLVSGYPMTPFFRFPYLQQPEAIRKYLASRNIAIWSADMDSFDFRMHQPDQVIKSVMTKLEKHGEKGIILMHDFQKATAEALPELLMQLKAKGYKVVQVRAKFPVATLAEYDEELKKEFGGEIITGRPMSSVIKTIQNY